MRLSIVAFFNAVMASGLRRWNALLLAGLCLATLLYGIGNLSLSPARSDALQNLKMGISLEEGEGHGGYIREPFVPIVIAVIAFAQRALGYEPPALGCVDRDGGQVETFQCRSAYAPYKILNVAFILFAGIGVFFLCQWYAGVSWLPHVAFLVVTQSLLGMYYAFDSFLTEIPAAALMVMVSCLSVLTLVRRRALYSALLGLVLGALVLTKIIFLYFWPLVVAGLVMTDLLQRAFRWRTVLLAGVFLVAHFLPIGGWMARNFVLFDDFSVVDMDYSRAKLVLRIRLAYNTMRDDEFAAGFWYYTPVKLDLDIPQYSYERHDERNVNGFYHVGHKIVKSGTTGDEMLRARMLAEPWAHLKVSMLMAWRGLFVQRWLGPGWHPYISLLRYEALPRELLPSLPEMIRLHAHHRWAGKEAYVIWFRERGAVNGYSEMDLKRFLNLETVAEFADATLYRVPPPDDFVMRGPRVSEFLDTGGAHVAHWSNPSGMRYHFREMPLYSIVFSNHVPSLPWPGIRVLRLAEFWGLGVWPRWGWWFDPLSKTLVNLVGGLALIIVPLWLWFGRRHHRIEVVFVVLPALYLHAVYAVISSFEPRYAQPEVPLRIWATLMLIYLVLSSGRRWGRMLLERRASVP